MSHNCFEARSVSGSAQQRIKVEIHTRKLSNYSHQTWLIPNHQPVVMIKYSGFYCCWFCWPARLRSFQSNENFFGIPESPHKIQNMVLWRSTSEWNWGDGMSKWWADKRNSEMLIVRNRFIFLPELFCCGQTYTACYFALHEITKVTLHLSLFTSTVEPCQAEQNRTELFFVADKLSAAVK